MTKLYLFNWISANPNDRDLYELEPVAPGYASPFDPDDEDELNIRLEELSDWYMQTVGPLHGWFEAPQKTTHDGLLATVSLASPTHDDPSRIIEADDVKDLRKAIEWPKGVTRKDCRFFVLYPKGREESEHWLVLRPQGT